VNWSDRASQSQRIPPRVPKSSHALDRGETTLYHRARRRHSITRRSRANSVSPVGRERHRQGFANVRCRTTSLMHQLDFSIARQRPVTDKAVKLADKPGLMSSDWRITYFVSGAPRYA